MNFHRTLLHLSLFVLAMSAAAPGLPQSSYSGPFELNRDLRVWALEKERSRTLQAIDVRFERPQKPMQPDRLQAKVNLTVVSWPKTAWQVRVKLLGEGGKTLGEVQAETENSGKVAGVPAIGPQTVTLDFDASVLDQRPTGFQLAVISLWTEQRIHGNAGNGMFEEDTSLPLKLRMDEPYLSANAIEFKKENWARVYVNCAYDEDAKARWRVQVGLYNDQNRLIDTREEVFFSGERAKNSLPGTRRVSFAFMPLQSFETVRSALVRAERVLDEEGSSQPVQSGQRVFEGEFLLNRLITDRQAPYQPRTYAAFDSVVFEREEGALKAKVNLRFRPWESFRAAVVLTLLDASGKAIATERGFMQHARMITDSFTLNHELVLWPKVPKSIRPATFQVRVTDLAKEWGSAGDKFHRRIFEADKEIRLKAILAGAKEWNAIPCLTSPDICLNWMKIESADPSRSRVNATYQPSPGASWRVTVNLFDAQDKVVGTAKGEFRNEGAEAKAGEGITRGLPLVFDATPDLAAAKFYMVLLERTDMSAASRPASR